MKNSVTIDREPILDAIESCHYSLARQLMFALYRSSRTFPNAQFVLKQFERIKPNMDLPCLRAAILRTYTVEPLVPLVRAEAVVLANVPPGAIVIGSPARIVGKVQAQAPPTA
jgi:hypothetical protein